MKKFLIILAVFVVVGLVPAMRFLEDDTLLIDAVAKGVGRTLAISLLSCVGLLFRRNTNLGFGIAAIVFTILSIVAALNMPRKARFNEEAVVGEIHANSQSCTPDFPLLVRLKNVSDQVVLTVGFQVIVNDEGHSTEYYTVAGSGMSTDRIIAPGQSIDDCYPMPAFYTGDSPTLAQDIPSALPSPQYKIVVTGASLKEAD